jgi:hypothetical protein
MKLRKGWGTHLNGGTEFKTRVGHPPQAARDKMLVWKAKAAEGQ